MDPKELGRRGEEAAARFLEGRGWEIVGQNVRMGRRELDLVMTRDGILAFVEVKSRRGLTYGAPLEAISPRKRQDVAIAAAAWLRERGGPAGRTVRFDAVEVLWDRHKGPRIRHVPDAWRMG